MGYPEGNKIYRNESYILSTVTPLGTTKEGNWDIKFGGRIVWHESPVNNNAHKIQEREKASE